MFLKGARTCKIPEQRLVDGRPFPLTIITDTGAAPASDLSIFVAANRTVLLQLLATHGAVLLRGWSDSYAYPVGGDERISASPSAHTFSAAVEQLKLSDCDMSCSSAPRTKLAPGVYTANEAPPSELIPFHHEMAQCPEQPRFVLFFCETTPAEGGETPILPSIWAARFLRTKHPDLAAALAARGVLYVRCLPEELDATSPLGRDWKSTFDVQTRREAEERLRSMGYSFTWKEDGVLRTESKRMPALVTRDGKELFYNQVIAALEGWGDARNDASRAVRFGDGAPFTAEEVAALHDTARHMRSVQVAFKWQAGDLLLLDNEQVMHSRARFTPPRRVLAALKGPPVDRRGASLGVGGASSTAVTTTMPALTLRSFDAMPCVGLGVWKISRETTAAVVYQALLAGYRHLDCACDYGNEREVGLGIALAIAEGVCTREQLFVTSKLWNTFHAREHVEMACRKTLMDLGLACATHASRDSTALPLDPHTARPLTAAQHSALSLLLSLCLCVCVCCAPSSDVDLYLIHFPIALRYVPFDTRYPPEWVDDPHAATPRMELASVAYQVIAC